MLRGDIYSIKMHKICEDVLSIIQDVKVRERVGELSLKQEGQYASWEILASSEPFALLGS